MTACVFVVQRVIEEDACLAYGSVLRDERALTQAAAVLVRFDDVTEDVLAAFGPEVDDPARLEPKPEVAHHTARMHEGHGRVDDAVGTKAVRRGKDLLGGNVGKERGAIRQVACTALPDMSGIHADREVGAVSREVVQTIEGVRVQATLVLLERGVMRLPGALRVLHSRYTDSSSERPG